MKLVIAPDSFKESLSAAEVAGAIATGWRSVMPDAKLVELPVADGGEGTTAALVAATGGECLPATVSGPLGEPVEAFWGRLGDGQTAVIECAAASGLDLVPPSSRDPCHTSSRGTGELIRRALDSGARHILLGLGGSATNDAGAGMLQALGARLLDRDGRDIGPGGIELERLERIDLSGFDPRIAETRFEIACDVDNPLTGPNGASAIFGPQKGADPAMVQQLDACLKRFADCVRASNGRDIDPVPGAGAAGGLGGAFLAFCNAQLKPGIEIVLDAVDIDRHLVGADLVITGEGRIDGQTARGKTPLGVAQRAQRHGVPVIALGGSVSAETQALYEQGITALFSVVQGVSTLEQALSEAEQNLQATARNLAAVWKWATKKQTVISD